MKSNLEPIEESDLDLEGKIKRGVVSNVKMETSAYLPEKEVSQEISSAERDNAYGNILSKVQLDDVEINSEDVSIDAETGSQMTDAQSQISHLIDIAQQKGIVHAVKVARHMEDNYVLDTFHDKLLADELHDALILKGIIKEL